MNKEIAPISARRELQENIRYETGNIRNSNTDSGDARKNIKKWQDAYSKACPENLDAATKNAMWKKAKELKDQFTIGMLSKDELHPVSTYVNKHNVPVVVVDEDKMSNGNTVQRQKAWDDKQGSNVREYKNIMRHLNPDNPNASDVEKFRPKRRTK